MIYVVLLFCVKGTLDGLTVERFMVMEWY